MSAYKRELETLKRHPDFYKMILAASELLQESGALRFLRYIGRPQIHRGGENVQVNATEAARSAGFNDALDCIMDFREIFLDIDRENPEVAMDFGGVEIFKQRGDLLKEEADAIRLRTDPPEPSAYLDQSAVLRDDYRKKIAAARGRAARGEAGTSRTAGSGRTSS